jgi:hypothetical protein
MKIAIASLKTTKVSLKEKRSTAAVTARKPALPKVQTNVSAATKHAFDALNGFRLNQYRLKGA